MYDYRYEPHRLISMTDNRSFYANRECLRLGLSPMTAALTVLSRQPGSDEKSSLIMAASSLAKKEYGLINVMRAGGLPPKFQRRDLILIGPHMNLYIQKSMEVLNIFRKCAAEEDIHIYSVDESIVDMTKSWHLFGTDPYLIGRGVRKEIRKRLGLHTACGIGENPLLAKLAIDIEAKKKWPMIAFWHYIDVPNIIWQIKNLEDVWGINKSTTIRLKELGISGMNELAHCNPEELKSEFRIIGEQLFTMSWGVDRSIISQRYHPEHRSVGNSQVLMRDYLEQHEIEIVVREIAEQVAARIRKKKLLTNHISLHMGFSKFKDKRRTGINASKKIIATNDNLVLTAELRGLFRKFWKGEVVRTISIAYPDLLPDTEQQPDLFVDSTTRMKHRNCDCIIDSLREKYSLASLVKAFSLLPGATSIKGANLVGGHNGRSSCE